MQFFHEIFQKIFEISRGKIFNNLFFKIKNNKIFQFFNFSNLYYLYFFITLLLH